MLTWDTLSIKAGNLHNAAAGTIAAGVTVNHIDYAGLIGNIAGDLTDLGQIYSITAKVLVNALGIIAGGNLQLSARNIVNDECDATDPAMIGASNSVTITTASKLDDLNGSLLAQNGALTIDTGTTLTNRGLISAAGAVNIDVATLANDAALARIEGTAITVKLSGNLANLGTILSVTDDHHGGRSDEQRGRHQGGRQAHPDRRIYAANSPLARLEALGADLILSGGSSNGGTVLAGGRSPSKPAIFHNAANGTIAAASPSTT